LGRLLLDRGERAAAVRDRAHGVALRLERPGEHAPDRRVVVDDEEHRRNYRAGPAEPRHECRGGRIPRLAGVNCPILTLIPPFGLLLATQRKERSVGNVRASVRRMKIGVWIGALAAGSLLYAAPGQAQSTVTVRGVFRPVHADARLSSSTVYVLDGAD